MSAGKPRIEDRSQAILQARLRGGGAEREACLLDLSSRGFMAIADPPPPRGSYIELIVGRHSLVGQVQWSEERRFGVRLRERVDTQVVLGNEAGPAALKAAKAIKSRPSLEARLAFSRHFARGFTYGILAAVAGVVATTMASAVSTSLAPLAKVTGALAGHRASFSFILAFLRC